MRANNRDVGPQPGNTTFWPFPRTQHVDCAVEFWHAHGTSPLPRELKAG
jgi:hypothetical protein